MFNYQSVNGANIVSLDDSEKKNVNFWKTTFYSKMMFFKTIWIFLCLVKQ